MSWEICWIYPPSEDDPTKYMLDIWWIFGSYIVGYLSLIYNIYIYILESRYEGMDDEALFG